MNGGRKCQPYNSLGIKATENSGDHRKGLENMRLVRRGARGKVDLSVAFHPLDYQNNFQGQASTIVLRGGGKKAIT